MAIYVVSENDTVNQISLNTGISSSQIIYDNQLVYPYQLTPGQALYLEESMLETDINLRINGYAYPFITQWVLENTLPYLSVLSVFSYGFTREGYLVAPVIDDERLISTALSYNSEAFLTLTPLDESGKFNNNLITSLVNNEVYKSRLIEQLLDTVINRGFSGVDVDFEFILRTDRDAFTEFVRELTEVMNLNGFETSVALAPKTSATQAGLLYEGKDYKGLGGAANHVLLMTYEYGYKYGPNMAVSPISQIRRVVEYAVSEIDNTKVNLGIPNYGYDWTLPFTRNESVARTIGIVEAVQLAIQNGVPIQFDELSQSPYFNYTLNGLYHEVWFEDVRSILAKINLIKEYQLEGAGYWQVNQLFRANWLLLNQQVNIIKKT